MRALRLFAISFMAVVTTLAVVDGPNVHCRRAASGRSSRGRSDRDQFSVYGGHIVEDSVGLGWADEVRTGGQLDLSAELSASGPAERPVFLPIGVATPTPETRPVARLRLVPTSRGPPAFLS